MTANPRRLLAHCLLFAAMASLAGCLRDLEPARDSNQASYLEEAAVAVVNGARVVAQADEWPGAAPIGRAVTPLRIVIENGSPDPVRIRYREFALELRDGRRLAALPPHSIDGDLGPPPEPRFSHRGFAVAEPYRDVYPGVPPFAGRFDFDSLYHETYGPYWQDIGLPTTEMLELALPEGVVYTGGSVAGYLYFEKLPLKARRATLRADLINAETGAELGRAEIPFVVE